VRSQAVSLTASPRLRRRRLLQRLLGVGSTLAAIIAVGVLVALVGTIISKGAGALNLDFFTKVPAVFGQTGGGVAPAIVGSTVLLAWAILFSLPMGVLAAIYLTEFAPRRIARALRMLFDILTGVPAIVIGIFVFALLVKGKHQSAYAGAFALSVLMLPIIARSTMEVLALVPRSLREASLALGVSRWRTVVSVVLPPTLSGIGTGLILAVARAAGEAAPLLFVCSVAPNAISTDASQALASLPLTIFTYSESPDPGDHAKAWAAALILISFVLVTSILARVLAAWHRRRFDLRASR
jgi:phosphate transport system permease protein